MQAEQEQNRQSWLHAFGLTPWVASVRLPGAQPAPLLALPEARIPAYEGPTKTTSTPPLQTPLQPATGTPIARTGARTGTRTANTIATSSDLFAPRPVVCLIGTTLLVAEQQDRQAPELSRDEQRLLGSLLHLYGDSHKRYPFPCPRQSRVAQDAFATFVGSLAKQGCARLLLCLSADSLSHLCSNTSRYRSFTFANLPALAISSLAEMLATPLPHRKDSWKAMQGAGFDR
jgi:hypothetical protein